LKRLGCRFALDDFGAGFGSFYYLKYLPLDFLKIDGDFIRDLASSPVDQVLVRGVVEVARGLGMETIAECVEDAETLALLSEYEVDYAQGFHVGRPRPAFEVPQSA
jgi:EAL domain-containing protein (putative c-di-GMP-specific phosphodiesterase class I)